MTDPNQQDGIGNRQWRESRSIYDTRVYEYELCLPQDAYFKSDHNDIPSTMWQSAAHAYVSSSSMQFKKIKKFTN